VSYFLTKDDVPDEWGVVSTEQLCSFESLPMRIKMKYPCRYTIKQYVDAKKLIFDDPDDLFSIMIRAVPFKNEETLEQMFEAFHNLLLKS
jgi:hypothetical protein